MSNDTATGPDAPVRSAGALKTGRCLCGAVSFAYEGRENWRAHCHCESCRRACAAPFTTFLGVPDTAFRWTGRAPATYASSEGVQRSFCPVCGSQVAYKADRYPDEIHLYAALLDDAAAFEPRGHVHWAERLPWIHLSDDLKKKEGSG